MTEITMTEGESISLKEEVLGRAAPCDVCGMVIPRAAVALVARGVRGEVRALACTHRYCRSRLRALHSDSSEPDSGYVH